MIPLITFSIPLCIVVIVVSLIFKMAYFLSWPVQELLKKLVGSGSQQQNIRENIQYFHSRPLSLSRVRTKLESPWMSLNLKTKIQGLECPWICKEVLESSYIFLALVFGYFLKLFDIQNGHGHFVELILHVRICLKLIKIAFWKI
jgi:hypothetical protein